MPESPIASSTFTSQVVSTSKTPWIILGVVVVAICLLLMWLAPAYKQTIKERDELKIENTKLHESMDKTTYYENGHVKEHIVFRKETDSNTTDKTRDFSSVTVKRSLVTVGVLFGDSYIPKAASFNTTLIGPIGAQGMASWSNGFTVMVGPTLSF